jgi:hypothetical protein
VITCPRFGDHYFIYDAEGGKQEFAPDTPEWFAWLAEHSSFHFTGKQGHFTARQEKKQRGEAYWYAYRKASGQQHKRYLGPTRKLFLAHLEEVASALQEAVLGSLPEPQLPNARQEKPSPQTQELLLGSLTFQWHEGLLTVKTATERHYLNRFQAAELLGYLYDRRSALLKKDL